MIWVQGCTLACPGCWNEDTHVHSFEGYETTDNVVWSIPPDVEGVTISGGEPMQQAPDLLVLLRKIRQRYPTMSIGMFTGYSQVELERGEFSWLDMDGSWIPGNVSLWNRIKDQLDFAVMGRFNQQLQTRSLPMRSSTNQRLVLLTSFYQESDFTVPEVEITISAKGNLVCITGFPTKPKALQELCV